MKESDPFWEPDDAEVFIGSVHVYLQSLAYQIEVEESLAITDHKGNEKGKLQVEAYPCDQNSEDLDDFVEEPEELIGRALYFKLKIPHARGLPTIFGKGETFCKYKLYLDHDYVKTKTVSGTMNPSYDHEKKFTFNPVTKQLIDYLLNTPLLIEVWGKQSGRKISTVPNRRVSVGQKDNGVKNNEVVRRQEAQNMKLELHKSKKRNERSEKKFKKMRELLEDAKKKGVSTVEVAVLEDILNGGEGSKFKATANIVLQAQKSMGNDGKITSSACSMQ